MYSKKGFNLRNVVAAAICLAVLSVASCNNRNNPDNPDNPNNPVPDPAGTITANISASTAIVVRSDFDAGEIAWTGPDNFYLIARYVPGVSICDLGTMQGLGNITNIPQTGYTIPAYLSSSTVACQTGHGYVVKFELSSYGTVYVRLYVVEKIISTGGGIMGATVKYQYPFEP